MLMLINDDNIDDVLCYSKYFNKFVDQLVWMGLRITGQNTRWLVPPSSNKLDDEDNNLKIQWREKKSTNDDEEWDEL